MTQVPVRLVNGVYRADEYPRCYASWFKGEGDATFCLESDLGAPDANIIGMPRSPVQVLTATPVAVTDRFFGMGINGHPFPTFAGSTVGTVRNHDTSENAWKWVERNAKGDFRWTRPDEYVNANYAAGRDIIWTLMGTPTWASARPTEQGAYGAGYLGFSAEPANMQDWVDFCAAVADRYKNKGIYYEVWNEPRFTGPSATAFWSGTAAKLSEMVRLAAQTIRALDPTAKILCPSITGWTPAANQSAETSFVEMMNASDGAGGAMKNWIDIVAIHLYYGGNATANMPGMIDRIKAAMATVGLSGLPIWDTESAPISPAAAAISTDAELQWMKRAYITMLAKGVQRSVYYTWNHVDGTDPLKSHGVHLNTAYLAEREAFINQLRTNGLQGATALWDGRVAYYSGGQVYVV